MEDGKPKLVVIGGQKAKVEKGTVVPDPLPTSKEELLDFLELVKKQVESGQVVGMIGLLVHEDKEQTEFVVTENETVYSVLGRLTSMINRVDSEDF